MKYYFSSVTEEALPHIKTKRVLLSFVKKNDILRLKDKVKDVIIDSGAFSVYNSGKTIDLNEYLDFCIKLQEEKPDFTFVNLDVIPKNYLIKTMNASAEKSLTNFLYMKKYIKNLMPIYHLPEDYNFYIEYLKHADWIGVGVKNNKKRNLDNFFYKWNKKTKIHAMGISGRQALTRYPFYSVDSTSWSMFRFIKQKKGTHELERAMFRTLGKLKFLSEKSIKEYLKLEEEITRLWKKRGIEWD